MISANFKNTEMHVGDTIRVHNEITEGTKTRIQIFEGILIRLRGRGKGETGALSNQTFTVRRISAGGVGVERTWPIDAKAIVKIEVKKSATNVRRSKLYYLRDLTGKSAVRV